MSGFGDSPANIGKSDYEPTEKKPDKPVDPHKTPVESSALKTTGAGWGITPRIKRRGSGGWGS